MTAREFAQAVVFVDEAGQRRPNPEAFGAGGFECYDPNDLVDLIEKAILAYVEEHTDMVQG